MATKTPNNLPELARFVRSHILRATTAAGSGHPTSSLSATDLMVALLFGGVFHADLAHPGHPNNDRFILSKGHAAPLLYALYAAAGKVDPRELLKLRRFTSSLEGHPMPSFRYTEVPTGSLGQGLSVGVGMSLAAQCDRLPFRTYVLLGDSEMAEGSIWEALQLASHRKLGNLTAILDLNRLGQSGPTMLGADAKTYARRVESFGWHTVTVDGHSFDDILHGYRSALTVTNGPTMIIAKTVKGKGVSFLEHKQGWHGKPLNTAQLAKALTEIGPVNRAARGIVLEPKSRVQTKMTAKPIRALPASIKPVSTREALGDGLVRLAPSFPDLTVLDGEVMNSTYTERFSGRYPRRFVQCFIAEQNMAGIANGLAARGKLPVAATLAAFWTRAFDQIRMASYAGTHQVFIGTHAGVHIGQDGASQMGLEDIALFRSLGNATILYPSDAVSAHKLLELALKARGLVYLRATRAMLPTIYKPNARFTLGGSSTLRSHSSDRATIVAGGVTVHEALKAADELAKKRISVRIIDLYSISPIDTATLKKAARQTKHLIVVEDHRPGGGIGEAVRSTLGPFAGTVTSLAVRKTPHSGRPDQLLAQQHIDAASVVQAILKLQHSKH